MSCVVKISCAPCLFQSGSWNSPTRNPDQPRVQIVMQLVQHQDVAIVVQRIEPWPGQCEHLLRAIGFLARIQLHGPVEELWATLKR